MPDQSPKAFQNLPEDEKTSYILQPDELSKPPGGSSFENTEGGPAGFENTVSLTHTTLAGGKYQINEEIGRGGMSVVYAATDLSLGRKVAVKVLLDEYAQAAGSQAAMRFEQEAMAVAKLSHPHIISIYEYGLLPQGSPFIVMDYVVGLSIECEMQINGLMSEERVLGIIKQSAKALRHSHSQGVVHRDIKPSNILLTKEDGEDFVRLVDFGIAKMQRPGQIGKLTATGQVFGSPLYMSPEQCEGLTVDARSDIYSLGCVAYEMITGRPPFVGKNVVETMHRKMTSQPQPFCYAGDESNIGKKKGSSQTNQTEFRRAFQSVILKMLAADPAERQQNAEELLLQLQVLKVPSGIIVQDHQSGKVISPKSAVKAKVAPAVNTAAPKKGPSLLFLLLAAAAVLALPGTIIYLTNFLDGQNEIPETSPEEGAGGGASPEAGANVPVTSSKSLDQTIKDTAADFDKFVDTPGPVSPAGAASAAPVIYENEKESAANLEQWISIESSGQAAFQGGDLEQAQRDFNDGLAKAETLEGSKKKFALDVSLSDCIDVDIAQTGKATKSPFWQQYLDMSRSKKAEIAKIDEYLGRALQSFASDGRSVKGNEADAMTIVLRQTLDRVKEEIDDERFGDAEKLLLSALPLMLNRQNQDGILAASYHSLAQIRASQRIPDWEKALDYAEKACDASQGNTKTLQANMAEALLYKALAQSQLDKSPEEAYNKAIKIDQAAGDRGNVNQIRALRGLALYYQKIGETERAVDTANEGLELAATSIFAKRAEAVKLACMAAFSNILGKEDAAISQQAEAIRRLDCTLPRQDYRVMLGLRGLARYYVDNKQPDMAQSARNRADSIDQRLAKLDKIYLPSAL